MVSALTRRRAFGVAAVTLAMVLVAIDAGPALAGGLHPLAATRANEVVPAAGRELLVWSRNRPSNGVFLLFARNADGVVTRVNPDKTEAFAGGIDGNALVYQEIHYLRSNSSALRWVNLKTGDRHSFGPEVNTPQWEWHPTVSGNWILFGRQYVRGSRGWDMRLFNTDTHAVKLLAHTTSRGRVLIPGQVGGRYSVWTIEGRRAWNVFRYDNLTGTTVRLPRAVGVFANYAPSVTSDGTVYMMRSGNGCGVDVELVRQPLAGGQVVLATFPEGVDVPTTYTFVDSSHAAHVLMDPGACNRQADIKEYIDDGAAPSPTVAGHVTPGVPGGPKEYVSPALP